MLLGVMSVIIGKPLWLLGVYAPVGKNDFSKYLKILKKKFLACV
jgi:hypothetical protein